jgi:cell division protein FtsI/penicillin-binding protein 2
LDILIQALLSAVFTIISCIIIIYLIKPNKDEKTSAAFVNYYCSIIATNSVFYLQVIDDTFKLKSENNAIKQNTTIERGYIYDRNGKLLVANQASYDIMVILGN